MTTKKLLLYFPKCETEKPIVYHLVKEFDLMVNIFRAKVTPEDEGYMVLDITGEDKDIDKGLDFVKSLDIGVDIGGVSIRWNQEKCVSCGNCLTHCPNGALHIPDRKTMAVKFDGSKCVECLSCLRVCPFNACSTIF